MRTFMSTTRTGLLLAAATLLLSPGAGAAADTVEVRRSELLDRIHGGWLGQMIGNLQGLPHEFKYMDQPRASLPDFVCGLPQGGWTDDDTDIEWVHIHHIDRGEPLKIPYPRLRRLWLANLNDGVWVANLNARGLMQRGLLPPATGNPAFNPASWFNLSGQFCMEAYGTVAPGMPQTAADLGLHYAHVTVWGEPIQAAQYWTTLIASAYFHEGSLEDLIVKSLAAVDPRSAQAQAVQDAVAYYRRHPKDWKAARQLVHKKWLKGTRWNANATPPNAALVVLALLYGDGDFYQTLQYAFALGYDADCNAATAGAVLGVRLGVKRIMQTKGFVLKDVYVNRVRDAMPKEVKISAQAEQLLRVAERVILANGGRKAGRDGETVYRIRVQAPRMLESLPKETQPQPGDRAVLAPVLKAGVEGLRAGDEDERFRSALVLTYFGGKEDSGPRRTELAAILRSRVEAPQRHDRLAARGGLCVLGDAAALEGLARYVEENRFNHVTTPDVLNILRAVPPELRPKARDFVKGGRFDHVRKEVDKLLAGWDKETK
jgi:ADP-ribosylglycohydrolase